MYIKQKNPSQWLPVGKAGDGVGSSTQVGRAVMFWFQCFLVASVSLFSYVGNLRVLRYFFWRYQVLHNLNLHIILNVRFNNAY